MGSAHVGLSDELSQNRTLVLLVHDDELIEACAPECAYHPLGHSVGARGSERGEPALCLAEAVALQNPLVERVAYPVGQQAAVVP